jgi:phosphonate transport system substrate-binding protein
MELPPSLGREPVRVRARELAALLYDVGFEMVAIAESYAQLEQRLMSGEADAAWGPPLACARLEHEGARVVLRALRSGSATYRAVIVGRAGDRLDLTSPDHPKRRPRAAWVDRESMGGYLLPRALLASLRFDLPSFLLHETFLGSYQACIEAVLEGNADITATFAPAAGAEGVDGYLVLAGTRAVELKALGYTAECPNDGVVLSPRLPSSTADAMLLALQKLLAQPGTRRKLADMFEVSGFDEPPPGTYAPLVELYEGSAVT